MRSRTCILYILHKKLFPTFNINEFPRLKRAHPESVRATFGELVVPQALDSVPVSVTHLIATVLGFVLYAVADDLLKPWPPKSRFEVDPQSEEYTDAPSTPWSNEQNIVFSDTHPGYIQTVKSDFDSVRDGALNSDATLDEFFSRPLRIAGFDWNVNTSLFENFNPWQLFFENPRVYNRISNYRLMRAKLHLKFVVNGNAFHYGRVIASYNPLPLSDTMTTDRAFLDADVVAASQRPHVYLDPTNSQGGEIVCPFFTYKNVLDIVGSDWRDMGEVDLHAIQTLKHANGATDKVSITVFAWATDMKYAIPTNFSGLVLPQADEYGTRPVSRIAGAVANAAGYLAKAPTIGPFARATQLGAEAVGAIATLFGYSSPVMLETSMYRPITLGNLATTNVPNESSKLSVDCKQELTIDPRTVGLSDVDELAISTIAKRESYIASFPWAVGAPAESLLFNILVDPGVHQRVGAPPEEIHLPATAFACMPFAYWRGTLKYRFQFVCSKYHKGRVKIVYDPVGTPVNQTAEYNTAYTTIVDISDLQDFSIDVGWGQSTPYRQHANPLTAQNAMFDTSRVTTLSTTSLIGNGTLSVYVVNDLTVPNSTIDNDIEVNVFITAGDDFEVAVPDMTYVERLRIAPDVLGPEVSRVPSVGRASVLPQAGEEENLTSDSKPADVQTLNTMGNYVETSDETNHIYFGETIRSFRQMLKRYNRHRFIEGNALDPTAQVRLLTRGNALPYHVGFTYPDTNAAAVPFDVNGGKYLYGNTTLLSYVTSAFGGWRGGIRWMADCSRLAGIVDDGAVQAQRTLHGNGAFDFYETRNVNTTNPSGMAALITDQNDFIGASFADGGMIQSTVVNPTIAYEVPYYSPNRFTPGKRVLRVDDPDTLQPGHAMTVYFQNGDTPGRNFVPLFCAAGEDFNCFFFLGAPVWYFEPTPPDGAVP